MTKPKSNNGSADHFPSDDDAEIGIINWKKIRKYESQLIILDLKETDKEKIIFEIFDFASRKNPEIPFDIPIHLDDFEEFFEREEFTEAMMRYSMVEMHSLGLTKKVHPSGGKYLINVTEKGLGKLRSEIRLLTLIKNCYPKVNENAVFLESRLKKRNKVLKKYEMFGLALV